MKKTLIALLMTCLTIIAAGAEEVAAPGFDREAYIASAGKDTILEMGMVDSIAMALKSNTEIKIMKIAPLVENQNIRIQKSAFEPELSFDWTMEDNTDMSDTPLFGPNPTKLRTGEFNFGYDQKLVTGTEIALDFYNMRKSSNARPTYQSINPSFDSFATVTVTQPLLKGFGITVNKANFLIAKNNKLKSVEDLKGDMIKTLTDVRKNYYNFQYSFEEYKVALASLESIKSLHYVNEERYAKGLASNVDLLQSESEVAITEEALLASEARMKLAEDNLKLITNLIDDPGLWNSRVVLIEELNYEPKTPEIVESLKTAFDSRPDYKGMLIDLKNKDINIVYYKNGVLPTMDLVGSYGLNGLAKTFEKDLGHIGGGKYEDWSIGVNIKFPLFSDEERGLYEKSKLDKEKALLAFKRLEQKIVLEVRDAVRNVDIKYRMLEASLKSKKAQEENYAAQETRFKAGLVSTHDILDYYERKTKAQVSYIKSVIDYKISLAELAKAQGTTLIEENISIAG